jgi:hypothetical protein
MEEHGDVKLAYASTHSCCDVRLINSGDSFHITPHMEYFCEYENYNGGHVFLGNESTTKIIRCGRVNLLLRTLLGVLYNLNLSINLISISDLSDSYMHNVFEKETWKMV